MKALTISDAEVIVLGLQDEIRRSVDARYDHRLHAILLVAQGMSCPQVGALLGDATRTVENWVRRFEQHGLASLVDEVRPGRPARLSTAQLAQVDQVLREPPSAVGLGTHLWDGRTLSAYVAQEFAITLGVRQAQRLFRQLGFRLRKPRPVIAHADPARQEEHKKNREADGL